MNLEDVIDPEYGLQQDEWSLSNPRFGDEGQLEVVGWSGKYGTNRGYILMCNKCREDEDLFGEGYFKSRKACLIQGQIPCGCSYNPRWSKEQYKVLCSRQAKELGYKFLGFVGEWKAKYTKILMSCDKHGDWSSGVIGHLVNSKAGCPRCRVDASNAVRRKTDEDAIKGFMESGAFHPETKFWRSERELKDGRKCYWYMHCYICDEVCESLSSHLSKGHKPCACSTYRQKEAYINWVVDEASGYIAIKFGIASNANARTKAQNSKAVYEIKNYLIYSFPDVASCKKAERECKQTLECGIVLKRDMPDGYTETTWVYNLDKIIEIYERNGGVKIENTN